MDDDIFLEAVSSSLAHCPDELITALNQRGWMPSFQRFISASVYAATQINYDPFRFLSLINADRLSTPFDKFHFRSHLSQQLQSVCEETELMKILREARHCEMLVIAWRDINGLANLNETMTHLSGMADGLIDLAAETLMRWQQVDYGVPLSKTGQPQTFIILAVGKLGSRELNFSSDVDLIFAFAESGTTNGKEIIDNEIFFLRLAQRLIRVLALTTSEGFVFRVDMRLRPFGDSGSLVLSFASLQDYYHYQAREWERYALIKGRVISGSPADAFTLMKLIKSFVYRRYIDYGSIAALRDMKKMIRQEVLIRGLSEDIKRGPGGIREVEFIGQVFQLMRGGHDKRLQQRKILNVLSHLKKTHVLLASTAVELMAAYRFLRRVEHALQMIADRQTHSLPVDIVDMKRVLLILRFDSQEAFDEKLKMHRQNVERHFDSMLLQKSHETRTFGHYGMTDLFDLWEGRKTQEEAEMILQALGYSPNAAWPLISEFASSYRIKKLEPTSKARLNMIMPLILQWMPVQTNPQQGLLRIITLLEAIVRRSTYIVLLLENPEVLKRLLLLISASPWIAEELSMFPFLLDELVDFNKSESVIPVTQLEDDIRYLLISIPEEDIESQMEALRRFKLRQQFRTAVADVEDKIPLMKVSDRLTFTAVAILRQLQELITKTLNETREGEAPAFAIIAYGKLGGIELSYESDLDLVFLHENGKGTDVFVSRLAQRLIHFLTVRTANGVLYKVDTRLRPSGSAGLLVSTMSAMQTYQENSAWTWEHQALVRARVVSGSALLTEKFEMMRVGILSRQRDKGELIKSILSMRSKMQASSQQKMLIDIVKWRRGGIIDLEFLVQFLVLAHAYEYPILCQWTDNIRILETTATVKLISQENAEALVRAYQRLRAVSHTETLTPSTDLTVLETLFADFEIIETLWHQIIF